jgi:hypothetical protein
MVLSFGLPAGLAAALHPATAIAAAAVPAISSLVSPWRPAPARCFDDAA